MRHRADQVLAVVDHEQQPLPAQRTDHRFEQRPRRRLLDPEERSERGDQVRGIVQRRELEQPRAVAKTPQQRARRGDRDARLADPAGADQRYGAMTAEQIGDAREVVVAADQRRHLGGKVVRRFAARLAGERRGRGRIDQHRAVAARSLGAIEAAIGALDQLVRMRAARGKHRGDADARRDDRLAAAGVRDRQRLDGETHALGRDACRLLVGIGKDHRELFTAVAREQVARAHDARTARARDALQARVPFGMTVGVVEALEVVDVEQCHGERPFGAHRARPLARQRRVERAAIGDAGQRVDGGQLLEPARLRAQRRALQREREVRAERLEQRQIAVGVLAAGRRGPNGADGAALIAQRRVHRRRRERGDAGLAAAQYRDGLRIVHRVVAVPHRGAGLVIANSPAHRIAERDDHVARTDRLQQPFANSADDRVERPLAVHQLGGLTKRRTHGILVALAADGHDALFRGRPVRPLDVRLG